MEGLCRETRMDDLRAVLDAADSERAVLFGTFEAASMCLLFAGTYPERTLGLVLYNPVAKGAWAPDYPWAEEGGGWDATEWRTTWGTLEFAEQSVRAMAPSRVDDMSLSGRS
jgi:pimeloyl-ACP methyl ester carboxylesterase